MPISDTINSLMNALWGACFAVVLWIGILLGPKDPPSSASPQLAFPFMVEKRVPAKGFAFYPVTSPWKNTSL